jgi:hypothetical protein
MQTGGSSGGEDVCAGQPAQCRPLCEGGSCQCDCSSQGGCDQPGWIETTLPWTAFNLLQQAGGGVTLCHPEIYTFADPQPSLNQPELASAARLRFLAYAGLDQAEAVRYVGDQDHAFCNYEPAADYGVQFVRIDGWAAMEQTFTQEAPICGACDAPPKPTFLTYANFYLAAGSTVIVAQAAADPADVANLKEVFSIVETMRVDNGETPISTSEALGELNRNHVSNCGG